jgi:hypothetical protein
MIYSKNVNRFDSKYKNVFLGILTQMEKADTDTFIKLYRLLILVMDYVKKKKRDVYNDLNSVENEELKNEIKNILETTTGRYSSLRRTLNKNAIDSIKNNKSNIISLFKIFSTNSDYNILCRKFNELIGNQKKFIGISTGTLTPLLSLLQPELFSTYNAPMKKTLGDYLSKEFKKYNYCSLDNYLIINDILHFVKEDIKKEIGFEKLSFSQLDNILKIIDLKKQGKEE